MKSVMEFAEEVLNRDREGQFDNLALREDTLYVLK